VVVNGLIQIAVYTHCSLSLDSYTNINAQTDHHVASRALIIEKMSYPFAIISLIIPYLFLAMLNFHVPFKRLRSVIVYIVNDV
jgi:hypothetical protein